MVEVEVVKNKAYDAILAALRKQVEAMRADAERYRWLRDSFSYASDKVHQSMYDGVGGRADKMLLTQVWLRYGSDLELAIDAAREKKA